MDGKLIPRVLVSLPTSSDRILAKFLANQFHLKGGVEAFELEVREEIIFLSKVCLNTLIIGLHVFSVPDPNQPSGLTLLPKAHVYLTEFMESPLSLPTNVEMSLPLH